jgi:hypothetical protein
MNSGVAWSLLAGMLLFGAGYPYARALRLHGPLFLAGCWLLGCGIVAAGMICLSMFHIGYDRVSLAISWVVVLFVGLGLNCLPGSSKRPTWRLACVRLPAGLFEWLVIMVFVVQTAYVVLVALRVPLGSFDTWSLWEYKGRRFWMDGGIDASFLKDRSALFAHPGYPPVLPLLIAWVYTWCGAADPIFMKPLFPIFFAALLASFIAALEPRLGSRAALLGGACLALMPRVADYAGTGLADVPLTACIVAAAAAYSSAREQKTARGILSSGLFLGLACMIKHDGLVFLLTGFVTLLVLERSYARVLGVVVPALLVSAPWYGYVAFSAIPERDFVSTTPAHLALYAGRIPGIARLFSLNLLSVGEWSVLWLLCAVLVIRSAARRSLRAAVLLIPVVAPLTLYVVSLSLSAWPDYMLHARTSLDRLIMVTAPFGLWYCFEEFWQERARTREVS